MTPDTAHSNGARIRTRDVPAIPIPGWAIRWDDGDFIATRVVPVTTYQEHFGALDEISCRDAGELFLLCDAQTRLAERLATAEGLHAIDRQQRAAAVQSKGCGS